MKIESRPSGKDIEAWQPVDEPNGLQVERLARELARKVYGLTKKTKFVRFLRYAKRSCTEVQSELYVALDQPYIANTAFQNVYDHAGRTRATIRGFIKYLQAYGQQKKFNPER